jgi:pyrimidine-nucleoside phosphorylase
MKVDTMNAVDLIIKKRQGLRLDRDEIGCFVCGVSDGSWPDYQISAMLMAMFIRGLDNQETTDLTLAMAASGDHLDLGGLPGIKVDKHSTGGVADTTTLILVPLVSSCGVPVVKLSGRGLGFTGGTIDKLESIPGFQVQIPLGQALDLVRQNHAVIMSQSANLTPADQKLYALRDVTGTIDSIPLIAASIMSKKIAAGADAIVLDVKCGNGSFMRDLASARSLARTMVDIGHLAGRRVTAVISSMQQPLGSYVGNTLEVMEAIEVLKGNVRGDLLDVSLRLGSQMLVLAGHCRDLDEARALLQAKLDSGEGLEQLRRIIRGQKGDAGIVDDYSRLPQPACRLKLLSPVNGWLAAMDTAAVGRAFVAAGGGRLAKEDPIDCTAGFIFKHRLGDRLTAGDVIAEIQANDPERAQIALEQLSHALLVSSDRPVLSPVILDTIE